jgi:hypothetical protein
MPRCFASLAHSECSMLGTFRITRSVAIRVMLRNGTERGRYLLANAEFLGVASVLRSASPDSVALGRADLSRDLSDGSGRSARALKTAQRVGAASAQVDRVGTVRPSADRGVTVCSGPTQFPAGQRGSFPKSGCLRRELCSSASLVGVPPTRIELVHAV